MKTNFISLSKYVLISILGFLSILTSSCGSYQNSSYYDRDGIYGNAEEPKIRERVVVNESKTAYKNYFNSLQDTNESTAVFTDVASYSNYNTASNQQSNPNYAGWGSNSQNTIVNYYPSATNWGLSFGFGYPNYGYGWGNSYYGWSPYSNWNNVYYGLGYSPCYSPYYGYNNYPSYGCNNPSYGYSAVNSHYNNNNNNNTNYSYNPSRRDGSYPNRMRPSSNYIGRTSVQNSPEYSDRNSYGSTNSMPRFGQDSRNLQNQGYNGRTSSGAESSNGNVGRAYNNYETPARSYAPSRSATNYTPARSYAPTNNSNSETSSRSYTPTNNNDSYTPSRSTYSNSNNSSGGYSGGRSASSGGRRGE